VGEDFISPLYPPSSKRGVIKGAREGWGEIM